jgi:hypothetical protein
MEKLYFVDTYFYVCPKCKKQSMESAYFAVFEKPEIGAARGAGLVTYQCSNCGTTHKSDRVWVNGDVVEVSKAEALKHKLAFESKGSA